jgi:hypothetical protein
MISRRDPRIVLARMRNPSYVPRVSSYVSDTDHRKPQEPDRERPIPMGVAVATLAIILLAGAALITKYLYRPSTPAPPAIRTVVPAPGAPKVAGGRLPANDEATRASAVRAILDEKQLSRINPIPRWNLPTTRETR